LTVHTQRVRIEHVLPERLPLGGVVPPAGHQVGPLVFPLYRMGGTPIPGDESPTARMHAGAERGLRRHVALVVSSARYRAH
jgi:hypothetical protein